MGKRMRWENLLSTKRVSDYLNDNDQKSVSQFENLTSPFEKDMDQIIFSDPFRRLQDKTQVIPFPKFDFVHTRLTHSLEVAAVGRIFGKLVSEIIFNELDKEKVKSQKINKSDIVTLIATACLAHDIGNPPFGHSGEDAISYYFLHKYETGNLKPDFELVDGKAYNHIYDTTTKKWVEVELPMNNHYATLLKQWQDLSNFEGNANGFRILTQNVHTGIDPTFALLGTFTKYPRESMLMTDPIDRSDKNNIPKSQTKYGFFQDQKELFKQAAEELGLIRIEGISEFDVAYKRHPLSFLMEASDDIAYRMIDFEDGCRLNLIDFEKTYSKFTLRKNDNNYTEVFPNKSPREILVNIANKDDSFNLEELSSFSKFTDEMAYLRGKIINVLVNQCFQVFEREYENIMRGEFDKSLIDCIENEDVKESLLLMKQFVVKFVYHYQPVLESEASGFEVMENLINAFAITSKIRYNSGVNETTKDRKLQGLMPDEFHTNIEKNSDLLTEKEKYERVLSVLDYITGMTEKFAITLYRKIKGVQIEH
jgi:dGTPase